MNINWLYDLPSWLFATLIIAAAVAIGLAGFYATRKWVRRVHGAEHSHNDIVGFFLGTVGLFYGSTLGLVAVGTMKSQSMHFWMIVMFSSLLGMMIYLMADLDKPFRGQISIDPEAFEMVYVQTMNAGK
jgi:hypothetical protein